ncbi:GTPase Der [endosymbiont of Euscepes postfasciatus]|uniref:GTPase n=1 Tax=endosymbiont of Euscepes postfasciatus TaxID=650377 RepID=UPI000DC6F734|nr:GTPase [endosymbiont of Euscepes postfasciatus]BBA84735.1 GTPase Der [endosymbiont of Euscepes postfasciatus]
MKIKISLIGKSKVGKTFLFNRLTSSKSIISNIKGTTRDREYKNFIYKENIIIIDTGSLIDNPREFNENIYKQTKMAILESNIIFFIVEFFNFNKIDFEIFNYIKKFNKEIILIINKIDLKKYKENYNFNSLNILYTYYVSVKKNIGMKNIFKYIINLDVKKKTFNKSINIINDINMLILGKFNSGKSTFINKILKNDRLVVSNCKGTTLNNIDTYLIYKNYKFIFTDTFGVDDIEHKKKYNNYILNIHKKYDFIIYIIDMNNILSNKDIFFIQKIYKLDKLILIFNKIDCLDKFCILNYKKEISNKLYYIINNIRIFYISALHNNVDFIVKYIYKLFIKYKIKIKTKTINTLLQKSNLLFNIYSKKEIKPKLKYAYILSNKKPFKIIIYGKNINYININHKKFLKNFFIKNLNLKNNFIEFYFKEY